MSNLRTHLLTACFLFAVFTCGLGQSNHTDTMEDLDDNRMGMKVLFDMVSGFLDVLQQKKITEVDWLDLNTVYVDKEIDSKQVEDWKNWTDYFIGFVVCLAIGIVFVVVMPVVGCVFCCCRCCGRCGGKKKVTDSKHAKCKRRTYCSLVLVFNTFILAGVICAFITNSLVYKDLQNEDSEGSVGNIEKALNHLNTFVLNSVQDVSHIALDTFDTTATGVLQTINDTALSAVDDVLELLNATDLINEAKNLSKEVGVIKTQLDQVATSLRILKTQGEELADNLTQIGQDVKDLCDTQGQQCSGFNMDDYKTEANFTGLGELSAEADRVKETLDIDKYINQTEDEIAERKTQVSNELSTQVQNAQDSVREVRDEIKTGIDDIRTKADDLIVFIPDFLRDLNRADEDIRDASNYIYYSGIGVCCVYLLIVAVYYTGVLFGLCGERPGHDAPCCNTGAGACCLLTGVALTFILSWLLMIICMLLFAVGGPLHTEVCSYFVDHDPAQLKDFDTMIIRGFDINKEIYGNKNVSFSIVGAISECKEKKAVYSAFKLDNVVDLDDVTDVEPIKRELDNLKNERVSIDNITILTPELRDRLQKFASAGLDEINYTDYFTELNRKLTMEELSTLANTLEGLKVAFSDPVHKARLQTNADRLREINSQTIPVMQDNVRTLNTTLNNLKENNNVKNSTSALMSGMEKSQNAFNTKKEDLVKKELEKLADDVLLTVENTVDYVKDQIRNNAAQCKPVTDALYLVTDSVCVKSLEPLNGLWFSMGWCLFFMVPCLIFAVLLASQYRREHEYEKEFDDPNYMVYGGHNNHDTIPLTRRVEWE